MTVSVIIPTHNYARFLEEAINSLRGGTYSDWECVVVDDGSTDDTPALVATLAASDPRIVYVSQVASGPSAARNAGLATASGEFVQFLDADDLLGPRKLQYQLEIFGRHPEADIVYGGVRYFDTAPHYGLGLAERRLGLALRDRPRAEFVVSTKVGRALVPTPERAHLTDDFSFNVPAEYRRE